MSAGYIFTHIDGKIYIRKRFPGAKRILEPLYILMGIIPGYIKRSEGYELIAITAIVVSCAVFLVVCYSFLQ